MEKIYYITFKREDEFMDGHILQKENGKIVGYMHDGIILGDANSITIIIMQENAEIYRIQYRIPGCIFYGSQFRIQMLNQAYSIKLDRSPVVTVNSTKIKRIVKREALLLPGDIMEEIMNYL